MARGITLTREQTDRVFVQSRGDCFRLRITASDAVLMPRHIFHHQQRLIDPHTGDQGDEFLFVGGPFDATIYPINEPDPIQFPAFFRKDYIDIILPSLEWVETAWDDIQEDVSQLIKAYNRLDTLALVETVRIGADLDESISESLSS